MRSGVGPRIGVEYLKTWSGPKREEIGVTGRENTLLSSSLGVSRLASLERKVWYTSEFRSPGRTKPNDISSSLTPISAGAWSTGRCSTGGRLDCRLPMDPLLRRVKTGRSNGSASGCKGPREANIASKPERSSF